MSILRSKPAMHMLKLQNFCIFKQLQLEEALLRADERNWCIINNGTPSPSIVMGISGKKDELINVSSAIKDQIPVIKRFSGGGTVIVDRNTIFVTIICNKDAIPQLPLFPRPIMKWTEQLYDAVFEKNVHGFYLKEHDYVFGERKFGGNAQSIIKNRWLHHTSFLWDYEKKNMNYLKIPSKAPEYRKGREHEDFICKLKDFVGSKSQFGENIQTSLFNHFDLFDASIKEIEFHNFGDHLKRTHFVPLTQ